MKVKIFMWQAMRGKLHAAVQICKRNGPGSELCALCGCTKDTDHIIFKCDLAAMFWCCIQSCFDVNGPLIPLRSYGTVALLGKLDAYSGWVLGRLLGVVNY